MKKNNKKINFNNQIIFIGIDVHKKSWTITIRIAGVQIKTFSMNPNPEELYSHMTSNYPGGKYLSVYEAGFSGYWIDRRLRELGINNIIVNPADVPTNSKEKTRKTDSIDSRKLARELSGETLTGIYIPSRDEEALRVLSRLRIQLTKDQTRYKNRIKSLLAILGVDLPENCEMQHWSRRFITHLQQMEFEQEELREALNHLLKQLMSLRSEIVVVLKQLRKSVKENEKVEKIVRCLQSVPGIGFVTAITLYTEIINIFRFRHLNELKSFVGIAPSCHSSGEKEKVGGMSHRQNANLRNIIIESAWIAVRVDPVLTMAFGELSKRMKKQEAIIRIAKKLLNRIMYVWKNEKEYVFGVVE